MSFIRFWIICCPGIPMNRASNTDQLQLMFASMSIGPCNFGNKTIPFQHFVHPALHMVECSTGINKQELHIKRHHIEVWPLSSLLLFRNLINKLSTVDLRFMTYKEKLAFWINTYNACFMHVSFAEPDYVKVEYLLDLRKQYTVQSLWIWLFQAFLRYGLPSGPEKLLALMNKVTCRSSITEPKFFRQIQF